MIPEIIKEKYRRGRHFKTRYQGKVRHYGTVEDYILIPHNGGQGKYLKGVEKLRYEDGHVEYRFMYWANMGKGWKWGQFCVILPRELLQELFNEMVKRGWI